MTASLEALTERRPSVELAASAAATAAGSGTSLAAEGTSAGEQIPSILQRVVEEADGPGGGDSADASFASTAAEVSGPTGAALRQNAVSSPAGEEVGYSVMPCPLSLCSFQSSGPGRSCQARLSKHIPPQFTNSAGAAG
jgi:hypothetical protein